MRGEGKRDPRPADAPGRLRQSAQGIRARDCKQIAPWKPGDRPNPTGYNGADWLKQFRDFFKGKTHTSETKTRYMNVLESAYLQAIKGKADVISMIVMQMNGKQHSTLEYAEHLRKIDADRFAMGTQLLGERAKTMTDAEAAAFLRSCAQNADAYLKMAQQIMDGRNGDASEAPTEEQQAGIEQSSEPQAISEEPQGGEDGDV